MSISLEFATTFPYSLPPRTVSRRGSKQERLRRNKASASSCIRLESRTLPRGSHRKFTGLGLGRASNHPGQRGRMFRNCKFAWSVFPARKPRTRFRERPGWMMSHWFRNPRSILDHEVAALRRLCAGRVCRCRARRCRGLGAGRLCDRRWNALSRLGLEDLFYAGRTNCYFSSSPAVCRSFRDRLRPVVFSWHCVFLQHADGTPPPRLRPHPPLSCGASFPHASGLARLRLVRNDFRVFDEHLRHPPAPYLQRKALLASRDAFRGDSIWALRE